MVFRAWLCKMQTSFEVSCHCALVYVHTQQMGLVWQGQGVPKLILVKPEMYGENLVMKLLIISDTSIHLLWGRAGGKKLVYSILISSYILSDIGILWFVAFYQHTAMRFSGAHTPNWQAVADELGFSPVGCAGCVQGMGIPGQVFLLTRLPWAYQVIPWWIYCLFKQVCVDGEEEKKVNAIVLLSLLS